MGIPADLPFPLPADIINAIGFFVIVVYGACMFVYERRMKKLLADAAIFAPTAAVTATGSLDEKDAASVDKLEAVDDIQYENVVRA